MHHRNNPACIYVNRFSSFNVLNTESRIEKAPHTEHGSELMLNKGIKMSSLSDCAVKVGLLICKVALYLQH